MAGPVFILATDLRPGEAAWARCGSPGGSPSGVRGAHPRGDALGRPRLPAGTIDGRPGRVPPRPGDRSACRRRGLGPLRAARRVRPEYLAADDAGRGAGRGAPPARRRSRSITIPSIPRTPCSSIVSPARSCGRWRSGASHRGRPDSSSSPTGRATPPPVPTPTA